MHWPVLSQSGIFFTPIFHRNVFDSTSAHCKEPIKTSNTNSSEMPSLRP